MPLSEFLQRSRATAAFREAVASLRREGCPNGRIEFAHHSPLVKVERTITKVLEAYPHLPIESVEIDGASGCEFFRGLAIIRTADEELRVRFHWDCRWKALQQGWTDYFGFPDQIRAAREFGYDCFREWVEEAHAEPAGQSS